MIIRHSMKILEQLTEIEKIIQKLERKMDELGIDVEKEKLLKEILENRNTNK